MYASPLRFRSPLRFQDAWRGSLAGFEVMEDWEVVNLLLERGALFWRTTVKLPFSSAEAWTEDGVALTCTRTQAFAREIPPVAAPARPLSRKTPLALTGVTLVGALVRPSDRRVSELIIRQALNEYRVSTAQVAFDGKTLTVAAQVEALPVYRSDSDLRALVWQALVADRHLTGDDRRRLELGVTNGHVLLHGNVRTKDAREHAGRATAAVPGVMSVQNGVFHDFQLEQMVGQALESAGLQRKADVWVRSSLGEVSLWGSVPSAALAGEVARTVSRLPGVREVRNRLDVRPVAAAGAGADRPAAS